MRIASGLASRCGSNVPLRAVALVAMVLVTAVLVTAVLVTAWLEIRLWSWGIDGVSPGPCILATLSSLLSVVVSLVTLAIMSDPPETMTGYAPFVMWRALTSDGRVTGWKLLLWPILVPVEVLVCLWLAGAAVGRRFVEEVTRCG